MVARNIANKIRSNSDDYCEGRIDYDTFHFRQGELWKAAADAGIADDVTDITRNNMQRPLSEAV